MPLPPAKFADPPRVAVFIPNLEGGGAERVTANLIGGLVRSGISVDLLVIRAQGPNLARIPPQVRVTELGAPRTLQAVRPLAAWLKRERPDALLAVMDSAAAAAMAARRLARVATRLVAVLHSATWMQATATIPFGERWLPVALRGLLVDTEAIVCVSHGAAGELVRLFPWLRAKVHTIYNPVVTSELLARAQEPPQHPWLIQTEVPVVVAVGRLCAAKDFATLIQAFSLLRARRQVRLIVFGDGELRADLQAQVARLNLGNSVQLPGWTDNPWSALSHAALFALSSEYEALPTVLIEALACGTPVVATDCRFGPREVLQDGLLGRLVPVRDAAALAGAMSETLDQPLAAATLQARAQVFSETLCTDQYLQLLLPGWTRQGQTAA
jgi:glycosyltransferase involved in cell wall biosynthesis